MYQIIRKIARRRLIVLDIAAYLTAFALGLATRYGLPYRLESWQISSYATVLVIALLFYLLIYIFYDGKRPPIMDQDAFDVFLAVLRNALLLYILLLGYLYLTRNFSLLSRAVFGTSFLYFVVLDDLLRLWYRKRKIRYLTLVDHPDETLLITRSEYESMIRGRLSIASGIAGTGGKDISADSKSSRKTSAFSNGFSGSDAVRITGTLLLDRHPDFSLALNQKYKKAVIYLPQDRGYSDPNFQKFLAELAHNGTRILRLLSLEGLPVEQNLLHSLGDMQAIQIPMMVRRGNVLGVNFCISNPEAAVMYVRSHLDILKSRYITFCNVHTTMESCKDPEYLRIQNRAALTFPDGAPIARQLRRMEYTDAKRVAGPDFMDAMFRSTMDGHVTHYFYGSSPETIRRLEQILPEKYPGIVIRGLYSPPYRPLTAEEDAEAVRQINESGADLVWVGLGAPKQERWMAEHEGRLHGVMLGVGAGFDFYAGTIKRAPAWVQRIGLEWLYRLLKDPKHLFKRYFITNLQYLWAVYLPHRKKREERRGTIKGMEQEERKA